MSHLEPVSKAALQVLPPSLIISFVHRAVKSATQELLTTYTDPVKAFPAQPSSILSIGTEERHTGCGVIRIHQLEMELARIISI